MSQVLPDKTKANNLSTADLPSDVADLLSEDDVARVVELLQRIAEDRSVLAGLPSELCTQLLQAAGKIAHPGRAAKRQFTNARRKQRRNELARQKNEDRRLLQQTGIRSRLSNRQLKKPSPSAPFPDTFPASLSDEKISSNERLKVARNCYICKKDFDRLHAFYDSLCPACADLNWQKRHQSCDLTGRYSLVTGGRVKIGFEAALKLFRAGSNVIVVTRFPHDAARRFDELEESSQWIDRLQVYGLDLRHTPSVERLATHLLDTIPRLDLILNNACQTVRRPPGFYAHMMEGENKSPNLLSSTAREVVEGYHQLRAEYATDQCVVGSTQSQLPAEVADSLIGIQKAAQLSQLELVEGDAQRGESFFPAGQYDEDRQQVDLREVNSWRLPLADVPTVELLEVHLVNAVAPFVLNARLKPLMKKVPTRDAHVINVSAMEGIFYRAYKTDKHPHTNMAKAALNMMTRTSAQDYVADGIYMNSVDTGWITDEDPAEITARKQEELDFHPPLDLIDAAARICDPFLDGLITGNHQWGKFLKDYQVSNW